MSLELPIGIIALGLLRIARLKTGVRGTRQKVWVIVVDSGQAEGGKAVYGQSTKLNAEDRLTWPVRCDSTAFYVEGRVSEERGGQRM